MTTVLLIVEILGVIAFAASGAMTAIHKELDLFGLILVSLLTTFGGGIIRDVLIGNTPPVFFESYLMISVCAATALAVFIIAKIFKDKLLNNEKQIDKIANIFDAMGLAVFAVSGTKISMASGYTGALIAVTMGMLSGCFGSLIRDVCLGVIPAIFRKRVYAVAAIVGSLCYWTMMYFSVNEIVSTIISVILIFTVRMCATIFRWNIPKAIDFSSLNK